MRTASLLATGVVALGLAAGCGPAVFPAGLAAARYGQPARSLAASAQHYLRTGVYSFTVEGAQRSGASGLAGLPAPMQRALTGEGSWRAAGSARGADHRAAHLVVAAGPAVDLALSGCDGYASIGGALWAQGEAERSLLRRVAPDITDAELTQASWADADVEMRAGVALRHLRAQLTAAAVTGGAAAGTPGVTLLPSSSLEVWARIADGAVAELAITLDLTADFADNPAARAEGVRGTAHSWFHAAWQLQPGGAPGGAPLATLGADPVPDSVRDALGPLAPPPDGCAARTA